MTIKRVAGLAATVLGLAIFAGCGGGNRGEAQTTCSLATLNGGYIFVYDGFNIMGATQADRLPFASAGHERYGGDGTVNGFSTTNSNGVVSAAAYAGTYTVDPDCSGTTDLTDENGVRTHYDIVIQQNGLVVGYVGTDPNVVTGGYESRRSGTGGTCEPSSLRGTYISASDGFETGGGTSTQRSPFAEARVEVYEGEGTLSGSLTVNSNGAVSRVNHEGTYTIDDNCAGEMTSASEGEEPRHFAIYIDPSGDEFAFVRVGADIVNAGYGRRQ